MLLRRVPICGLRVCAGFSFAKTMGTKQLDPGCRGPGIAHKFRTMNKEPEARNPKGTEA